MAEAENVLLYRRLIEEGVGVGRLDVLDEVLTPDISLPTLPSMVEPTLAGLKQINAALRAAMPDTSVTIDEIVAEGDWVAAKLTWEGTHTGATFMGISPSGRGFSVTEFEIVRCSNGRIVDCRQVFDVGSMIAQLSG
ncbi:MAG: ester cyclase [Acidimicrobiales bacterium]